MATALTDTELLHRANSVRGMVSLPIGDDVSPAEIKARTRDYYVASQLGYRLLHSHEGAIHMALNPTGTFNRKGYIRAPLLVLERLGSESGRVLELGCGSGFNLRHMSHREPHIEFVGIDLEPHHVRRAERSLKGRRNASARLGDFERLDFPAGSFTGAYSIESLCHATDLRTALSEIRRVVQRGGRLVVVDAWRTAQAERSPDMSEVFSATERSMSVYQATSRDTWLHTAIQCGWRMSQSMDLSEEVKPNLHRLEAAARRAIDHPRLWAVAQRVLPQTLLQNVVAGYLMAPLVERGYYTYELIDLKAE